MHFMDLLNESLFYSGNCLLGNYRWPLWRANMFLVKWGSSLAGSRWSLRGVWESLVTQIVIWDLGSKWCLELVLTMRLIHRIENFGEDLHLEVRFLIAKVDGEVGHMFYQGIQLLSSYLVVVLWYSQSVWSNWQSGWVENGPRLFCGFP